MAGRAIKPLLIAFLFGLLAAAVAAAWGYATFTRPGPLTADHTIVLPRGAGVQAIAEALEGDGAISDALVFQVGVRAYRAERQLRAGEYRIVAGSSMREIMHLLQSGKTVVRRLTIAEGLTVAEVMTLLASADGLVGEVDKMPPEGSILPETYHFSFGDTRQGMVERMQTAMTTTLQLLWDGRRDKLPLTTPAEAVVLASIVEKETALAHERPHIAGVFVNRLRRKMRLQSDPTVVYAVTQGQGALDRALTRADLSITSPYNTYQVHGLPPGPIANPGRDALAAVLQPLDTKDLYFVADGSGGHAFARTYAEHRRNVRRWRAVQRQRATGGD